MPYIEVNGARLYYETFGQERPGKAPILLLHGSTGTGQSNWSFIAPRLADKYYVIVPDCRGHGRSNNPNHSYSFKEMADDSAALIRGLGFERAHVIGHSNGGNLALVVLVEHPEVVQTAIPQAANAWISPDLPERQPGLFDPDRVRREDPEWMQQMITWHSDVYGPEYWRELLLLTVKELISEPNYTPEDLAKVCRPTLVIQGENDGVNAPYEHAQFIARYIPEAELWIPEGIGHRVHFEVPDLWMEKVLDFLKRRG
jgi:pimeloyl-ACP methyl ester carboxylesterase